MQGIDEDLQSRALAVYGRGAMKKLFATKVLISGINGLGAEIAKNVILANVNSMTLHDTKNTTHADLNSHFYLSESDIGENRAKSCLSQLAE
jgi:ubiquitin-activating enzyme E1